MRSRIEKMNNTNKIIQVQMRNLGNISTILVICDVMS